MVENEDIRPNESENPSASAGLPITLRPASPTPSSRTLPFGKDYTTLPEVKSLAASPDVLENEAHEELRRRPAKFLASLGLLDGSMNDLQDQALVKNDEDLEITRPSRSSTSSQSSTNSQSSQLSDSDLNDVQQSILVMLEDLNQGCEELLTLEKGRILSKFGGLSKIVELKNPVAKELQTVFWAVIQLLCDAQNNTVGMGFPDLGLELNQYNEEYKEKVLKSLRAARRSAGDSQWKSLLSSKDNKPWRKAYPKQIDFMRKTQKDISKALDRGKSIRDLFLNVAFGVIGVVVQKHAKEMGVGIHDQFCGNVLVSRIFEPHDSVAWQQTWKQMLNERIIRVETEALKAEKEARRRAYELKIAEKVNSEMKLRVT